MKFKYCKKCEKNKKLSSFHKDKTNADGLNRWCHSCKKTSSIKNISLIEVYLKRRWDNLNKRSRADRNITFKELWCLWKEHCLENKKQGKHEWSCKYTGEIMTTIQGKKYVPTNISIDRLDNSKGYEIDNIVFCTTRFNRIKGEWSVDITKKILKIFKEKGIKYEVE